MEQIHQQAIFIVLRGLPPNNFAHSIYVTNNPPLIDDKDGLLLNTDGLLGDVIVVMRKVGNAESGH